MTEQEIRDTCNELAEGLIRYQSIPQSTQSRDAVVARVTPVIAQLLTEAIDFDPTPFFPLIEAALAKWNPSLAPLLMRLIAIFCGLIFKPKS